MEKVGRTVAGRFSANLSTMPPRHLFLTRPDPSRQWNAPKTRSSPRKATPPSPSSPFLHHQDLPFSSPDLLHHRLQLSISHPARNPQSLPHHRPLLFQTRQNNRGLPAQTLTSELLLILRVEVTNELGSRLLGDAPMIWLRV